MIANDSSHHRLCQPLAVIIIGLAAACCSAATPPSADAERSSATQFRPVPAAECGIRGNPGQSYAGAWGDVNGDGYPDLWLNNHLLRPTTFYLNERDGTFKEVTAEIFAQSSFADNHGAAFADFDNDGDQDLLSLVGAANGIGTDAEQIHARLYVNETGKLLERATAHGVGYPLARGRSPLWLDFNRDGLLDLVFGVEKRRDDLVKPAVVFQQKANHTFVEASDVTAFKLISSTDFIYADLSRDGCMDLIADNAGQLAVYDTSSLPFSDVTKAVLPDAQATGIDMASADFNGDLQPDVYIARGKGLFEWGCFGDDVFPNSPHKVTMRITGTRTAEKGIQFETAGDVTIHIGAPWNRLEFQDIHIGATGREPKDALLSPADPKPVGTFPHQVKSFKFTLSPTDPDVVGVQPHEPGVDEGVYIRFDPDLKQWQILASKREVVGLIECAQPISGITAIGFRVDAGRCDDTLLINTPEGLIDKSVELGIGNIPRRAAGVVAGDFDNDMDVDIYVVTTGLASNPPNILFENQGDGTFIAVPDAGGAAGSKLGLGNFAIVADYDGDGFLDLLVANGRGSPDLMIEQGPYQLFQNESKKNGNRNHWLEIDLQGLRSNRDGIGARVLLTAGGKTQLREQSNGAHYSVQDHRRLHFGLGSNTVAQELLIKWPSGIEQRILNVNADQLLRVIESDD